jgi:hypothetical protein
MTKTKLKFAEEYVVPVVNSEKTATVRIGCHDVMMNHVVTATTPDGSPFAKLEVARTAELLACEAYSFIEMVGAKYGASNEKELIDGLNQHYKNVKPDTQVKVLVFERIEKYD